jgi:transcriptional regulator with XRE-family HTH domain
VTEEELRLELGRRLRGHRAAQDRTLASVAVAAGLSVPYVANLESGRGNPTLGALQGLARALGVPLADLVDDAPDAERRPEPPPPPASLVEFTAGSRFRQEMRRLAAETGVEASALRRQVVDVMTAMARLPGHFDELDWHRALDAVILQQRRR